MEEKKNKAGKTYRELEERIRELEEQLKNGGNREYKSRLFGFLFGREENKHWTLSLYNAIHGTSYSDPGVITINTIEDVVYMGMKNDVSILVSEIVSLYRTLELYEQQSTYNPNMPVREFMYAGKLYDKFLHLSKLNRYGRKLLPLPLPKLVVFYNGEDEKEDEAVLRLSDAFREEIRQNIICGHRKNGTEPDEALVQQMAEEMLQKADPDIEVKVRMVNINHGHNRKMLTSCRPLGEYAWFVDRVRKNLAPGAEEGAGSAIDRAIEEMPGDFEIKKYIMANRAEVMDMCLTEYNETEAMEMMRLDGLQEGMQKGMQETRLADIKNLMECTGWTAEKAMDSLKIPFSQRAELYAVLPENA